MMKFELGNGHSITVEKANRGIEDDYKVTFFEDGRKLTEYYATKDCIEWGYDVTIQDEEIEETETTPEGQRPDEDLLAYMERVDPELFASMKYLAGISSESEEDTEDIRPPPEMIDFNRIKIDPERRKLS